MGKPDLQILCFCDAAVVENGKMTIYGVLDQLSLETVPSAYPRFGIVMRFLGPSPTRIALRLLAPEGHAVPGDPMIEYSNIPPGTPGLQITANVDNLVFPVFGEYILSLICDGELLRSIPLRIAPAAKAGENHG